MHVSVTGPRHNGSSATFNTSSDIKIAIQVNSSSASSSSVTQQHCEEEDDKKNNNINVQVKFDTTPNGNINVREVSISPTKEENNDDDPEEPFDTSANELSIGNMVSPIKPTGNLSTLVINDDNNNVLSSNTTGQAVPTTDDGNDESSKLNETFTITSPEKDIVNPVSGLTGLSESLCLTPNQKSGASRTLTNSIMLASFYCVPDHHFTISSLFKAYHSCIMGLYYSTCTIQHWKDAVVALFAGTLDM